MIDVALATKNRTQQFKRAITNLNKQTIANKIFLYVLDGNNNNEILNFTKSKNWNFAKIQINQDQQIFPGVKNLSWPKLYNWIIAQGNSPYITYWSDDIIANNKCFEIACNKLKSNEKYGAIIFGGYKDSRWEKIGYLTTPLQSIPCINYGLIKRNAFAGIDETYHFYHADSDLSLKIISKGWTIYIENKCEINHERGEWENPASLKEVQKQDRKHFLNKWANYFPEHLFKHPPDTNDYFAKIKLGQERMQQSKAVICTTLKHRNPTLFNRLDNLAKLFKSAQVIIVTKNFKLEKRIKIEGWKFRVFCAKENLANMENIYMTATELLIPSPTYCIVVNPQACISQNGIAHTIGTEGWHAVGSNSRLLGNTHEFYFNGPSTYTDSHLGSHIMKNHNAWIKDTHLKPLQRTNHLISVASCFGDLIIYKYSAIKGIRYDKSGHVGFINKMKSRGSKYIKMNPNQLTLNWHRPG